MNHTDVFFVIDRLSAYGAENIAVLLCNAFFKAGKNTTMIITRQHRKDAYSDLLDPGIKISFLQDEAKSRYAFMPKIIMLGARLERKIKRVFSRTESDTFFIKKYLSRNYGNIAQMKKIFKRDKNAVVIAFLNSSIFQTLLSAGKTNKVIISERGDPRQCCSNKTNLAFFRTMYPKADLIVMQSPGAGEWYSANFQIDGQVIFNPIHPGLPEPYRGIRKKTVVNFCRIARQKNLALLINAFSLFWKNHRDYELRIIGGLSSDGGQEYYEELESIVRSTDCADRIRFLPQSFHIHEDVLSDGMFVSSSDYEGMSNSMLEAMALGLPTICTDCPAGGARAIIRDHKNGILTPVGDVDALAKAMSEVADDPELAEKLSENAAKIRYEQSAERIIDQWLEIV